MRLFLVALLLATTAAPANAQSDRRERELAEIEARLKAREAEEKRLQDEAAARDKEVAALRRRMVETANSLQAAERRIEEIAAELSRLDAEEAQISISLTAERDNLSVVLAGLQALEMSRPPALLVSPDDANRAARAAMLMAGAAPAIEARASALRLSLDSLARVRADRDRERSAFEKTNAEIKARREILADLLSRKQEERDVAASLAAAAQRETAALAARATSLRDVLERLEKLATAITPRLKPAPPLASPGGSPQEAPSIAARRPEPDVAFAPLTPFSQSRGALRPPVVGRLAGRFGQVKPGGGEYDGLRFVARDQAIVTAPYEGVVAFARSWEPIGNLIVLDVGDGYHILLMGVSAFLVQEGQRVGAGEPIGSMIAPASGGEVDLDLEIRKNGEPVNPALWLSSKTEADPSF